MTLTHSQIVAAVKHLDPAAEFALNGDSYDGLVWLGEGSAPSIEALEAAWAEVEKAPPPPPDAVSSRQFKMQLAIGGIKTMVEAWVSQQDELVQIAYHNSALFHRDERMMQAGFAALGFTDQQIADFFRAASAL